MTGLEKIVKGEFFIRFDEGMLKEEQARELLESAGIEIIYHYITGVYQIKVPEKDYDSAFSKLEEMKEKKYIKSIEPVYRTNAF